MGQALCPEKRQEKHRGTGAHRSTHPQGAGRAGGRTHPHTTATALHRRTHTPQPQHYTDAPQAGQARHKAHHRTGAQHHTEAQHTEESTREYTRVHRGVL